MALPIKPISELKKYLENKNLLQVYFLFGTDSHLIEESEDLIKQSVKPFLSSEFDEVVFKIQGKFETEIIIETALAFPFGSGKKLVVVENFENLKSKESRKELLEYLNNPSDFTIMVITNYGKLPSLQLKRDSGKVLFFEAREKKWELDRWLKLKAEEYGLTIGGEEARYLIEITGQDKYLLQMQLNKFRANLGESKRITFENIEQLASVTRVNTVFDLIDALGKGKKLQALEIFFNLVNHNEDIGKIHGMLAKFIMILTALLNFRNPSEADFANVAKSLQVSSYFVKKCNNAYYLKNEKRLIKASNALLEAEIKLKTSEIDLKSLGTVLISSMLG